MMSVEEDEREQKRKQGEARDSENPLDGGRWLF